MLEALNSGSSGGGATHVFDVEAVIPERPVVVDGHFNNFVLDTDLPTFDSRSRVLWTMFLSISDAQAYETRLQMEYGNESSGRSDTDPVTIVPGQFWAVGKGDFTIADSIDYGGNPVPGPVSVTSFYITQFAEVMTAFTWGGFTVNARISLLVL